MKDKVKELLDEVIYNDLLTIENLATASGEKLAAIDDVVKLYKLRIEETKYEMECREKRNARMMEHDEKKEARFMERDIESRKRQEDLSEQTKDRYIKIGITTAEIVLPLAFYASWMKRGFKFEETGIFTSTTFRGLFNRFKPTK